MLPMSFAEILDPAEAAKFLTDTFGRSSCRLVSTRAMTGSFDVEDFETWLWQHEAELPARLKVTKRGRPVEVPRRRGGKDVFRWAVDRHLAGCVLALEGLERLHPVASALARDVEQTLVADVGVEIAMLPPSSCGTFASTEIPRHVIVLGVTGEVVCNLQVAPNGSIDRTGDLHPVSLGRGQAFYAPSCRSLTISAAGAISIAAIVTIAPLTGADLLAAAVEVASETNPALRRTVPFDSGPASEKAVAACADVARALESEELTRRAWQRLRHRIVDRYRVDLGGQLSSAMAAPHVTPTTRLRVRPGAFFAAGSGSDEIFLYVPGLGGAPVRESEPGGLSFPA